MSLFFEDFDEWYEAYETASPLEQYEIVLGIVSSPIPLDYAVETDFVSILIEVQGLLEGNNLLEHALSFIATLQKQQPALYQQEFYYFDNFPIRYALFSRELSLMDEALARYKQDPVKSIDELLPILDDLRFYDAREQAADVSHVVYQPVATSSKLMGYAEDDFGAVIMADMLEQTYETLQQGNTVDWEAWGKESVSLGFENTTELQQEIVQILTGETAPPSALVTLFQEEPEVALRQLSLRFNVKMAAQNQLSFVCSQAIWSAVIGFLGERQLSKKQLSHPDRFFDFEFKELDRYIGRLMGNLFSFRQSMGFAVIWGLPHVYDVLRAEAVIEEAVYDSAIATTTKFQALMLKGWSAPLWRFSFVHRWGKPKHQTDQDFADETQRFASTIDDSEPLSTEPTEKPDWEKILTNMAKEISQKSSNNPGLPRSSTSNQSEQPPANAKPRRTPKPRKSPIQEVKALNKGKGSKKKKKKGKGFS
ncbi:MAG: hypothetical protein HLUCCA11_21475 [Phormidesmis priestleyi Ana]|uniref:Uncharacterized protein n=1 Tax=Phormidesmis priestleyi Ana TaxID=1666911 RepID=A0A0P7ZCN6_9CYAN|nr:MAG: hypothetical protein HLUCCA11_21475 [Phormidesmis priestleyi Ana]